MPFCAMISADKRLTALSDTVEHSQGNKRHICDNTVCRHDNIACKGQQNIVKHKGNNARGHFAHKGGNTDLTGGNEAFYTRNTRLDFYIAAL